MRSPVVPKAGSIETAELRLADGAVACIAVGAGNTLFELRDPEIIAGRNLLHFPFANLDDYRDNHDLGGNPFLYPWANRLADPMGYSFRDRRIDFPAQVSFWRDGSGLPLHGCLLKSDRWRTLVCESDRHIAEQVFDKQHPAFECFPYTHRLHVQHRLERDERDGRLRVTITTRVQNTGEEELPLAFGYHPYISFAGYARDSVRIRLPARQYFETDERLLPTGRLIPTAQLWPDHQDLVLAAHSIDHGFTELEYEGHNANGGAVAEFQLITRDHCVTVCFGAAYKVAMVYAPLDRTTAEAAQSFVCFEPMLAPTNPFADSVAVPSGSTWRVMPTLAPGGEFSAEFSIAAESC